MSNKRLSTDQLISLLTFCGASQIHLRKNGEQISACCPIHGESRPSFGVSVEKQVFNCFSCGAKGHIATLLCKVYPEDFRTIAYSVRYISEEFAVDIGFIDVSNSLYVPDYESMYENKVAQSSVRKEKPFYEIAHFRSGKSTYKYFFDRGFTKETAKKFLIGMDTELETVTIPVFWEDGKLAGVIGRFVGENVAYNKRYHVYDFEKGGILYPLDKFYTEDGTIILVEGILDAIWLHQWGYTNTLSTMGNGFSKRQLQELKKLGKRYIVMSDADEGGRRMLEAARRKLGDIILNTEYPDGVYDPQQCTYKELKKMIENAEIPTFHGLSEI